MLFFVVWEIHFKMHILLVYGVSRRGDFVNRVTNEIYNIDKNHVNYSQKITNLISSQNVTLLTDQLMIQPNAILPVLTNTKSMSQALPILYAIGQTNNIKLFDTFLSFLHHFSKVILNDEDRKDANENEMEMKNEVENEIEDETKTSFLSLYLNFNGGSNIINNNEFWGY